MLVQDKIAMCFISIFMRFNINFLKNALEFNCRVINWNELQSDVSNSIQNVLVLRVDFW